jgi:hypothetical protein
MLNLLLVAALGAGAVLGEPPAQPTAQPGQSQSVAAKPAEKTVCRRIVVTGSITPKRTCRSQAEWDEMAKAGEEDARKMGDNAHSGGRGY